jgi:alpha-tubulin suppressor-like RCC1 family protein
MTDVPAAVLTPAGDEPLVGVANIDAGDTHSCAALLDGTATCWGSNNGRLGDGTTTNRNLPVVVSNVDGTGPLTDVSEVVTGDAHSCALRDDGTAVCWGSNHDGQLGDGTKTGRTRPVAVLDESGSAPLGGIVALTAGYSHTCAALASGQARCWGETALGSGDTGDQVLPRVVLDPSGTAPLTGVAEISAGYQATCAALTTGQARCWGSNPGDGTSGPRALPVVVSNTTGTGALTDVASIDAGDNRTCAVTTGGQAWCWGGLGVGDGTLTTRTRPIALLGVYAGVTLAGVSAATVGEMHNCAVVTGGELRCWGANREGRLGDGAAMNVLSPGSGYLDFQLRPRIVVAGSAP